MVIKFLFTFFLIVVVSFGVFQAIKHPEFAKAAKKAWKRVVDFVLPTFMQSELSGLERQTYKVLESSSTISNLLMYSYYKEEFDNDRSDKDEKEDGIGIYYQRTGRKGFILELNPPPFLTESVEKSLNILLSNIKQDNLVIQFITYSSDNIKEDLEHYVETHQAAPKIDNPEILKMTSQERAAFFQKWTKESTMGKHGDFRIRNFKNLLCVLFPAMTPIEEIKKTYSIIKGQVSNLGPKNFRADSLLVLLHEILAPGEPITTKEVDLHRAMNAQFAKGVNINIFEDDPLVYFSKKKVMGQMLTTEKFPRKVEIDDFQAAFFDPFGRDFQNAIPGRFYCSLTIHMDKIEEIKQAMIEKSTKNLKNTKKTTSTEAKIEPKLVEVREEAENVIKYITDEGQEGYAAMWNLMLFEEKKSNLDFCVASIKKKFEQIHTTWKLKEETFSNISLLGLIYSLPLQFYEPAKYLLNSRFDLLFKANNAAIAPIMSDFKGFGKNLLMYVGRTGQKVGLDFFASDTNYNLIVIGPPGTGKSMFMNDFIRQYSSAGARIFLMDIGDSYQNLVSMLGGQYVKFKEGNDIKLNFYTHINTKRIRVASDEIRFQGEYFFSIKGLKDQDGFIEMIHEDEFDTIVPMIGIMCGVDLRSSKSYDGKGQNLTKDDSYKKLMASLIESAVTLAFLRYGRNAGMKDVYETLDILSKNAFKIGEASTGQVYQNLYNTLYSYGNPAGKSFKYFNGAFNINMDNWIFVLEQEELKNKGELLAVISFAILQRIAQISFLDENRGYLKIIAIDESSPLLENVIYVSFLDDFSRRIRKYNGTLAIITQYVTDFFKNDKAKAIFDGAAFKVFLEQESKIVEKIDTPDIMYMTEFEKELLKSIKKRAPFYSEFMLQYRDLSVALRLVVTPTEYALYTTNPQDRKAMKDLEHKLGIPKADALFVFARKMAGYTEDQAMRLLAEKNINVNRKYWEQKIRYAIAKNMIEVYSQPIVDQNYNSIFFETLMRIKDEDNELFSPSQFYKIAETSNQLALLESLYLDKVFGYFKNNNVFFSINISASMLKKDEMIEALFNKIERYNVQDRIILEIDMHDVTEETVKNVHLCKSKNLKIAIDKVNLKNFNLHLVMSLSPEFIKVDGTAIGTATELHNNAELIQLISQKLSILTIVVYVSSETMFNNLKNNGIQLFQGYYIAEPADVEQQVSFYLTQSA